LGSKKKSENIIIKGHLATLLYAESRTSNKNTVKRKQRIPKQKKNYQTIKYQKKLYHDTFFMKIK